MLTKTLFKCMRNMNSVHTQVELGEVLAFIACRQIG